MDTAILICAIAAAVISSASLIAALRAGRDRGSPTLEGMERRLTESQNRWQQALERLGQTQSQAAREQTQTLAAQAQAQAREQTERLTAFTMQLEQKLENIRLMTERQLGAMREESALKLEQMRATVDEKLQKTLEERIGQSFKLVSERLEQVHRGLGEMQALAGGVGDLKRVLSGVKTRGILGEIQLGAILEQLLSPEQYASNVVTRPDGNKPVEFAVKMPGSGEGTVWLPIDSKFPYDRYSALCDAYDAGDGAAAEAAAKELLTAVKTAAKDIREKYVEPPHTTDFGILFLPFEGLYAEVVRRGMVETLQREYKINVTGPTTMGAFLNSLQMGFRTLAVQKRSVEVWKLLGQVKTEFERFSEALEQAQKRIEQTGSELEKLVGVRTRGIRRALRSVELPESEGETLALDE